MALARREKDRKAEKQIDVEKKHIDFSEKRYRETIRMIDRNRERYIKKRKKRKADRQREKGQEMSLTIFMPSLTFHEGNKKKGTKTS